MAQVIYQGPSDAYELSAADFKRLGVEDGKKTAFPRGEAVEVDDSVAEALLAGEKLAHSNAFKLAENTPTESAEDEDEGDANEPMETGRETTSGDAGVPATTGGTTTGARGRGGRSSGSTRTSG